MKKYLTIAAVLMATTSANAASIRTQLFNEQGQHIGVAVQGDKKTTFYYDNGRKITKHHRRVK